MQKNCTGALRVYSQIRSEKYPSVRKSMPRRLRPRSTQLEQKILIQAHDITMFAPLTQQSYNEKSGADRIYLDADQSGPHSYSKNQYPIFRPLIDIPVTTMLVHECFSPND